MMNIFLFFLLSFFSFQTTSSATQKPSFKPTRLPTRKPSLRPTNPPNKPTQWPTCMPSQYPSVQFNQRKSNYIDNCLTVYPTNKFNLILQARRGVSITSTYLQSKLSSISQNSSAFDLLDIVRISFFTSAYDTYIQRAIASFRFWLTINEKEIIYWTENLSISFMSSHWLLNQKFSLSGYDIEHLRSRLLHWLHLKVKYGFYEFYSKVYQPYTLNALLNLVDFATDSEISSLAAAAAQILLRDLLMMTNDQGVAYSVAGRDYWRIGLHPAGNNYNQLVYLLTGVGSIVPSASGPHLATTTLDVSSVFTYWRVDMDLSLTHGHPGNASYQFTDEITTDDATLSLWTTGSFAGPQKTLMSKHLCDKYNLWAHTGLSTFSYLKTLTDAQAVSFANTNAPLLFGRDTAYATIKIFKSKSVMLTSLQLFHPSYQGYQTIPFMASVATVAVWASVGNGHVLPLGSDPCAYTGLPYVKQSKHVALLVFSPDS